jgi:hypothetical protein
LAALAPARGMEAASAKLALGKAPAPAARRLCAKKFLRESLDTFCIEFRSLVVFGPFYRKPTWKTRKTGGRDKWIDGLMD